MGTLFVMSLPVIVHGKADAGTAIVIVWFGSAYGAVIGIPVALLVGATLLRRVPAVTAMQWCFVATAAGAAVGVVAVRPLFHVVDVAPGWAYVAGAAAGLLVASLVLWRRHRIAPPA
jgi:hypothetical protein